MGRGVVRGLWGVGGWALASLCRGGTDAGPNGAVVGDVQERRGVGLC